MSRHSREWLSSQAAPITTNVARGRFTGLLVILLTLALLSGVVHHERTREVLICIAFFVLLLFAIGSVGRRLRFVTAALGSPALVAQWLLYLGRSPIPKAWVFALTTTFLAFLTLVVLFSVLRDEAVTADTIVGAVCVYILIGMAWGTAYALVALNSTDAFAVSPGLVEAAGWGPPTLPFVPLLEYYSMTTLSSLGFGDISPLSGPARTLSALEGAVGQVYIAVLIARLVGIHTARRSKE
jgi:voltage-gated potassium channel